MPYDIIIGRSQSDKEKFGDRGLIYIGKGYVKMGNYTSMSNKIWMDVARTHAILVAGKRGSGKCLHGDTLITLADGSQIPIRELEDNKEKVFSLNNQLKIECSKKSDFFSRGVNNLLRVTLRSGKEIKLTREHPLLTIKGWKPAQELTIGSRIATPRKIPSFGNNEMPEHEVKLLAYLLAEGHLSNGFCLFSNFNEKIINEFNESVNSFDTNLKVALHSKPGCFRVSQKDKKYTIKEFKRNSKGQFKDNNIIYEKSSIIKWLTDLGVYNKLSAQKFIPKTIMKLKKEQLSVFLNRLFSCDGSIYQSNGYWQTSYACSSEIMIRQIQSVLLKFDILSKLRTKKIKLNGKVFRAFELVLNEANSLMFMNQIGFFGKKEERQKVSCAEIAQKIKNPNVDTIPREVWEMYKPQNWAEIGRQLGYAHPKAMRERIHYAPSRQTLLQIAEVEQSNPLQMLATSDIFWDEIVKIELLEGNFKVYDICVPENHNFIANDIIVHNSYTIGAIAEELSNLPPEAAKNIASIIFDTMGIFWTMKYKNEKDAELLQQWGLEAKELPVKVFCPFGKVEEYQKKGIPIDSTFALESSELDAEDWAIIFKLDMTSLPGVLVQRTISSLKEKRKKYTLEEIQKAVESDHKASKETKEIVSSLFNAADTWGIFSKTENGTEISDLVNAGTTTVLDTSVYSSTGAFNIRALVISLITKKLFRTRMDARKKEEVESIRHGQDYLSYSTKREEPLVWIFIDEAHEFLPNDEKTPATDALKQVLREGRQPGLSLVLATQQPGKIHPDVMTQSDIIISHRVTAKPDREALNEIMQSYLLESIQKQMNNLPSLKGSAIILDDNSERLYPMRVRPRFTWHGGEAPTAIKGESKL